MKPAGKLLPPPHSRRIPIELISVKALPGDIRPVHLAQNFSHITVIIRPVEHVIKEIGTIPELVLIPIVRAKVPRV